MIRHALIAQAAVMVILAALGAVSAVVPFLAANLGAAVAVVFLLVSAAVARWRHEDIVRDHGLGSERPGRELVFGLGVSAVVFPLFVLGFAGYYALACGEPQPALFAKLIAPGQCAGYAGLGGVADAVDWLAMGEMLLIQLVVVALPEELFFRGTIHGLLERALVPKRRLLGGGVGWALVLSSALFAVAHLVITPDPRRLAVFFPALLFGWMRSATGSILPAVFVHALSNVLLHLLFVASFA